MTYCDGVVTSRRSKRDAIPYRNVDVNRVSQTPEVKTGRGCN